MKRLLLIPIVFTSIGCVSNNCYLDHNPNIWVNPYYYGESTSYTLANNYVLPDDDEFRRSIVNIRLDAQRLDLKDYNPYFQLLLLYSSTERINIENGESLILFLDGHRLGLKGENLNYGESKWHIFLGTVFTEGEIYPVTPGILTQIANAKQVRMKIIGRAGSREASFTQANTINYKCFIKKYVAPISTVSISKPSHMSN